MKHLLTLAVLLLCAACGGPLDSDSDNEADGPTLYLETCADCHGVDARGTEQGPDLRWRTAEMTIDDVADTIALGQGQMRPLDLDDDEADAVARFLLESLLQVP